MELTHHCHQYGEPPEHRQHGQGQLLRTTKAEDHIAEVHKREGPDLAEGVRTEVREGDDTDQLGEEKNHHCSAHLTQAEN